MENVKEKETNIRVNKSDHERLRAFARSKGLIMTFALREVMDRANIPAVSEHQKKTK